MLGDVPAAKVLEWRRVYGWPSVKIGRTIRFTEEQVDEILARHTQAQAAGDDLPDVAIEGQTKLSAARSAS
jgi:hypothetical protein